MEEDKNKTKTQNPMTIITSDDLVREILKFLPAKSLDRFKSVSKHWRAWASIEIQSALKFLVVDQLPSKVEEDSNAITLLLETFSRDHDNNGQIRPSLSRSCTISDYSIEESQRNVILVWGSCDGLVLISFYALIRDMNFYGNTFRYDGFKYIYLINPKTMEQRTLSLASLKKTENQRGPVSSFPISVGFGKDIITGSYKVILMYLYKPILVNASVRITVLSLNSGEQRNAGVFPVFFYHIPDELTSVYVNGSLFWLIGDTPTRLVAMDLHTEKFRLVSLPNWYTKYSRGMRMWSLNDRLCLSDVLQCSDLDVWSLQQEDPYEKWEKIYTFNISNIGCLDQRFWKLGLAAAYFRRSGRSRSNGDFLDYLRTTVYTPTLISPYRL
ncbi:hypothetical protein EUTSA_v10009972mg [Eutrema salsugineum]|uniref:Uncharacterized protein n=1 Tax=Eutrema salsugineum TaxID=72664 RepID=V4K9P0_EUTSA|nr:putative F-box protein At1g71320 [Eutrema salsugineum]ESQ34390.1 hypothetical protein EUTSA_v10009972mg [Eutrema salsugineum]